MLSQIDLIIITGFIEKNMEKFNQFCIDECIGTAKTGAATLRHLKEHASQQIAKRGLADSCDCSEAVLGLFGWWCLKCGAIKPPTS